MKDTRRVVRGIGITENDKYRVETDPDRIAGIFSQSELDAYVEDGVLMADNPDEWRSTKPVEGAAESGPATGHGARNRQGERR